LIWNQHFRLFVRWKAVKPTTFAGELLAVCPNNTTGKHSFESSMSLGDRSPPASGRITWAELRPRHPEVMRGDQQHHPIYEDAVLTPSLFEIPGVGILNRTTHMALVAVPAIQISGIESRTIHLFEVMCCKDSSWVRNDMNEIPRRSEVTETRNLATCRALFDSRVHRLVLW
jgi:hypothetical protein